MITGEQSRGSTPDFDSVLGHMGGMCKGRITRIPVRVRFAAQYCQLQQQAWRRMQLHTYHMFTARNAGRTMSTMQRPHQ